MESRVNRLADLEPYKPHPSELRGPMNGHANGKAAGKSKVRSARAIARFKTMNEFVDQSARLVDTTAQAVWLVLFREVRANGIGKVSFGQIAECIGVSRRTVIRAVQHLEEAKLVTVVQRGRMSGGPSTYRVHGSPPRREARTTTECDEIPIIEHDSSRRTRRWLPLTAKRPGNGRSPCGTTAGVNEPRIA